MPRAFAMGPSEVFFNSVGLELLGDANRMSLAPGYNFGIFDWLQAGGSVSYQTLGYADTSVNTMTISVGPTFNMGGPYSQAAFIFFGLAKRSGNGVVSDTTADPGGTGLSFQVGKRIPLFGTFSYRPTVGIQMVGKTTFVINALGVAYLF